MLNEERIVLMTKMAVYEEREGRKNVAIGSYFRGDYISLQVLKAVISATIVFGILFVISIFYDFESFMLDIYKMDLLAYGRRILVIYGIFVIIYGIISYIVYSYRYNKVKRSLKQYYINLKRLSEFYD